MKSPFPLAVGVAALGVRGVACAQPHAGGYRLTPVPMTWAGAHQHARSLGGSLASVGGPEENLRILQMLTPAHGPFVWLGGRDHGTQAWAWTTGEPFSFAFWAPGCPGHHKNESFVVLINEGSERGGWCNYPDVGVLFGVVETCYANCDDSAAPTVLSVADFGCFLTRYAAGEAYANCDGSTALPVLNVADFGCFLTKYAAGCP